MLGRGTVGKEKNKLNKLKKKAGSVVGSVLPTVDEIMHDRMIGKLSLMINHDHHPLNEISQAYVSTHSSRLIHPRCYKEHFRKSFFPTAIRFYNQCYIR